MDESLKVSSRGRPKIEDPRDIVVKVRMNDVERCYLSLLCDKEGKTASEIIRDAIRFYLQYKGYERW